MKKILTVLTLLIGSLVGLAQTKTKISGTVIDGSQKTIESATISLVKIKDSSTVKFSVADKDGKFAFENIPNGSYQVVITAVGHQNGYSEPFEISDKSQ